MKAVIVNEDHSLSWGEVDHPKIGDHEVLIRISATAINRADLMQRNGFYPPPPGASEIMGLECAGEIVEVGVGCTRFKAGDKFALCWLVAVIVSMHLPMRAACCQSRMACLMSRALHCLKYLRRPG